MHVEIVYAGPLDKHNSVKSQLFDVAKPLKVGVGDDIVDKFTGDGDKSINGIINYLLFNHPLVKFLIRLSGLQQWITING